MPEPAGAEVQNKTHTQPAQPAVPWRTCTRWSTSTAQNINLAERASLLLAVQKQCRGVLALHQQGASAHRRLEARSRGLGERGCGALGGGLCVHKGRGQGQRRKAGGAGAGGRTAGAPWLRVTVV